MGVNEEKEKNAMRMNEKHAAFTHKTESQLYKIGMFAQMNHITVKALRFYDELFSFMPEMGAEMERLGCRYALPEYCFTHYLEPGYKEDHILIETCEAVTEKKEDTELVKFRELPEITAACIFHKGSYDKFPETYAAILRFIEDNGYEICGNIRENYIDGIWNKDREEDWLSEIQIPVRMR